MEFHAVNLFLEEKFMETLHLRAEHNVIEKILNTINQFSNDGQDIEILDNVTLDIEQKMILKSLTQEHNNQVISHDNMWDKLLG